MTARRTTTTHPVSVEYVRHEATLTLAGTSIKDEGLWLKFGLVKDDIKINPDPREVFFQAFEKGGVSRNKLGFGPDDGNTITIGGMLEDADQVAPILEYLDSKEVPYSPPKAIIIGEAREQIMTRGRG